MNKKAYLFLGLILTAILLFVLIRALDHFGIGRTLEEQLAIAEMCLEEQGRPAAIKAYEKVIRLYPDSPEAYIALAGIYIKQCSDYKENPIPVFYDSAFEADRKAMEVVKAGIEATGDERLIELLSRLPILNPFPN